MILFPEPNISSHDMVIRQNIWSRTIPNSLGRHRVSAERGLSFTLGLGLADLLTSSHTGITMGRRTAKGHKTESKRTHCPIPEFSCSYSLKPGEDGSVCIALPEATTPEVELELVLHE